MLSVKNCTNIFKIVLHLVYLYYKCMLDRLSGEFKYNYLNIIIDFCVSAIGIFWNPSPCHFQVLNALRREISPTYVINDSINFLYVFKRTLCVIS